MPPRPGAPRRGCRLALALLACILAAAGEEPAGTVIDQPLRFVNGRVITVGDLRLRNGLRVEQYRRAGRVLPTTREGLLAFHRDTLEELTDEELLLAHAEELGVRIDREGLASDVRAEARERALDLRQIARLRRWREREAMIQAVLNWVEARAPGVTPSELQAAYAQRRAEFVRPARARARLIALRPAGEEERREQRRQLAALMRDAQQAEDPRAAAIASGRLEAFLAADVEGQLAILRAVARELAELAEPLPPAARPLAARARALLAAEEGLRDAEACVAQLERWRAELLALPPEQREARSGELARQHSQGPHAADDGDLGWVDAATYGAEMARQALATPLLEPSPVFWAGGAAAMLLVTAREEAYEPSFAEVSGILLAALERERRQEARRRLLAALRARATLHDIVDIASLLP